MISSVFLKVREWTWVSNNGACPFQQILYWNEFIKKDFAQKRLNVEYVNSMEESLSSSLYGWSLVMYQLEMFAYSMLFLVCIWPILDVSLLDTILHA